MGVGGVGEEGESQESLGTCWVKKGKEKKERAVAAENTPHHESVDGVVLQGETGVDLAGVW